MEIIFVSGKGGVGKSAVAAAIALQSAQQGKKTLLVELGDQSFYQDYFESPEVHYKPLQLQENFHVSLWTGQDCLREYALHLIKVESLYKLFFENQVTRALITVAPALPELAILGKITSGPPRNVGPKMNYDCLVVDAYASGHFMALLHAPAGMAEAVGFGPMGEQTRAIQKIISDAKICKYLVVSLPEELPVVEALELSEKIEKCVGIRPRHLLNKTFSFNDNELQTTENLPEGFTSHLKKSVEKQKLMKEKFSQSGHVVQCLPWIFKQQTWSILNELAKAIRL